jgi:hypothetical protein
MDDIAQENEIAEAIVTESANEQKAVVESTPQIEEPKDIRGSLKQNLNISSDQRQAKIATSKGELAPNMLEQPSEFVPVAAPSDMNKAEREAFANPTPENAHVLQGYLSRRGYELKADYSRQTQELRERVAVADEIHQTFEPYAQDYEGLRPTEILSNAILWDQGMKTDPIATAWEYLETYNIHPQDLLGYDYQPQQQSMPEYLTKEEADALAEEKISQFLEKKEQEQIVTQRFDALDSFKKSKPLFRDPGTAEQLEAEMAPLVHAEINRGTGENAKEILERVYNYVTSTNPVFSGLVSKLNAKPMIDKKIAITNKAKAASRSISGSPGSGLPKIKTNMRENLRLRMAGSV